MARNALRAGHVEAVDAFATEERQRTQAIDVSVGVINQLSTRPMRWRLRQLATAYAPGAPATAQKMAGLPGTWRAGRDAGLDPAGGDAARLLKSSLSTSIPAGCVVSGARTAGTAAAASM
jgi:hypothetical protein